MTHSNVILKIMLISIFLFTIPKTTYPWPRFRRSRTPSPVKELPYIQEKNYNYSQFQSDNTEEISTTEKYVLTYNKLLEIITSNLSVFFSTHFTTKKEGGEFIKKLKEEICWHIFSDIENKTRYRREGCFKEIGEYPIKLSKEVIRNCVNTILDQLNCSNINLDL